MDLKSAIKKRRSVRVFSNKKVDWRKILRAVDYARFAPMAGNYFPLKFILVSDKDTIRELADASGQGFVGNVQYIVVVISMDSRMVDAYGKRGKKYARQQSGAAIENFLLGLLEQGLDTCWVGHFSDAKVKRAIRMGDSKFDKHIIEGLFPIGKASVKSKANIKRELDSFLYFDYWDNSKMVRDIRLMRDAV